MQAGIPVARVELLDEVQVRACNIEAKLGLRETPTLFLEFHGTDAGVAEQAVRFGELVSEYAGGAFEWATKPEDRSRLWQARHHIFFANKAFRPGSHAIVTDVCVPIARLAECLVETKRDIDWSGLIAPLVAHAGDGNFHATILVMMNDPDEVARARAFIDRLVERALAMEGTCTGEHAIGQGKKQFLETEHGIAAVAAMKAVKQALDPQGIMNPGKIF
jgi:D-lactate dehydrogenase (cytochrome)